MFLKHENKFYQELNYKMFQQLIPHELKMFVIDSMTHDPVRTYQLISSQDPDLIKKWKIQKQSAPEYLKFNNPNDKAMEPINRSAEMIIQDHTTDVDVFKAIVDSLLVTADTPNQTPPLLQNPKHSGNEMQDLRDQITELTKLIKQQAQPVPTINIMNPSPAIEETIEVSTPTKTVIEEIEIPEITPEDTTAPLSTD